MSGMGEFPKVLSVSFGAFSCRLEGFDDPVETLVAVAGYFRELAASDPGFAHGVLVPDAAALARQVEAAGAGTGEVRIEPRGAEDPSPGGGPDREGSAPRAVGPSVAGDADEAPRATAAEGSGAGRDGAGEEASAGDSGPEGGREGGAGAGRPELDRLAAALAAVREAARAEGPAPEAAPAPAAEPLAAGAHDWGADEEEDGFEGAWPVAEAGPESAGVRVLAGTGGGPEAADGGEAGADGRREAGHGAGGEAGREGGAAGRTGARGDGALAADDSDGNDAYGDDSGGHDPGGEDEDDDWPDHGDGDAEDWPAGRFTARVTGGRSLARAPDAAPESESASPEGRRLLSRSPDQDEEALRRFLSQAERQLSDPEIARRHEAMAHLKAAVAAAEAQKALAGELPEEDPATLFREEWAAAARLQPGRGERGAPPPLRLVASQRVDVPRERRVERGPEPGPEQGGEPARRAEAVAERPSRPAAEPAAMPSPAAGSFAAFAAEAGAAASLPDVLEAAAAWLLVARGEERPSRTQLLRLATEVLPEPPSREDALRVLGILLRQGRLARVEGGRFRVGAEARFDPARHAV